MSDRLALIIANSEFEDPALTDLVMPSRDAEALAEVLADPDIGDFQVTPLLNAPLRAVRGEISRLYRRRKRDDLLLLYYSGHGFKDDYGELYFAVKDTERRDLDATALDAVFLRRRIDQSSSQRKVVVLDCCHSGAFSAKSVLGTSVGTEEALVGSGYGQVVFTATDAVQYAWEGDRVLGDVEASVFTHFLVEGLQTGQADLDGDGGIGHDELYRYVYEQILRSGVTRQTPLILAPKVEGQIIIAKNPHAFVKPAELPPKLQQAIESPFADIREGAVRVLVKLLQGSDKGLVLAAHEALTRLTDDDSRRVSAAAANALSTSPLAVAGEPSPKLPPPAVEKPKPKPEPELHPSLAPKLSVKPQTVDVGDEAKWTVTLRNDGDDNLSNVNVKRGSELLKAPFRLTAGKGRRFTFTTTYEGKGAKTERVTVTGIASNGKTVRDEASATLQVRPLRVEPEPDKDTMIWPKDGKEMVRVPAGVFLYGDDKEEVELPEFWIDKTPVTNAEYARFVADVVHAAPQHWKGKMLPQEIADHPVTYVTWHDAVAYAEWAGKGLPTEQEWEKAARGTDGRTYPWGSQKPTPELCNFARNVGGTTPVGQYSPQGDSLYGCADMAGNVWEWTASEEGRSKVLRGGSWDYDHNWVRSAYRDRYRPPNSDEYTGFRCCVAPTPLPVRPETAAGSRTGGRCY